MEKEHVTLSDSDRVYLESLVKKGNVPTRTYKRVIALLELDRGRTYTDVAETVGAVMQTVSIWANKYKTSGLEVLVDKPRTGRPVVISGEHRAKVTALACSDPPEGYERWSLRLLADKAVELGYVDTISHAEVGRILKKTNSSHI